MSSNIEQLVKLQELLNQGLLTAAEFEIEKRKLLGGGDSNTITVGQNFREYFVESLIGEGGMGAVYKVRHRTSFEAQGYRALKVIKPDLLADSKFRARFVAEANKGMKLNHPNVARVFDLFEEGQNLYILMEFVNGPCLSDFGTVPIEQAFGWLKPICETLDFIHGQGIVHRDIKPENIRLHPERGPVLLDFGIAKDVSLDLTQSTVMMGTPLYMAPEQLDAASVTGAADQYAVAMMTYRWLSGRFPWDENASRSRIDLAKLMGKLLPLSDVKDDLPDGLSEALMRGLSIEPSERYVDCAGFYGALSDVGGVESVSEAVENVGGTRIVSSASSTRVVSSPDPVQPVDVVEPTKVVSSPEDVGSTRVLKEDSVAQTIVPKSVAKSEEPSSVSSTESDVEVSKGSSGVGLKIVAGLLLLGGLGYGGYAYNDSVEQSGFQSRVDEISESASRFEVTVPSGRLSKEIVFDFEELMSDQMKLGSRVDQISEDASRFEITVPSGRLSESEVSSFEKTVTALISDTEKGHPTRLIPAGEFTMGCTSELSDCDGDESPSHKVTISRDFLMMESEVTQGLYKKVTGKSPSYFSGSNRPVDSVSWFDAVNFANGLSELEGLEKCYEISGESVSWSNPDCKGWRLPTEAEWEYAARGGQSYKYAGSNNVGDVAWYRDNSGDETHEVCGQNRNGYGLCDMSGNAWEWVWDWIGYYISSPTVDPQGPTSGSYRVKRGGGWSNDDGRYVRVSNRFRDVPTDTNTAVGFRLCRLSP